MTPGWEQHLGGALTTGMGCAYPGPHSDLDHQGNEWRQTGSKTILSNSFCFAGQNA